MAVKLSSVEEYFEKHAAKAGLLATLKGAKTIGQFVAPLGRALLRPRVAIPLAAGGVGLGIAGATGVLGGIGGERAGSTMSYRVNRALNTLYDRIRADEVAAEAFAQNLGSSTADKLVGLTSDVITKGYESLKDTLQTSPVRKMIFTALKKEDPTIADAPNSALLEAYHTMAKVAPTLSTDKNAVKSFLREAIVSGGGVDYNTIRGVAEAEAAVNKVRGKL